MAGRPTLAGATSDGRAGSSSGGTAAEGGTQPAPVGAGGALDTAGVGGASTDSLSGSSGEGGASSGQTRLEHPGILNSASELAAIKSHVVAHAEPWASAFTQLQASPYASLSYAEKPYASVECGSYNQRSVQAQ